MATRIETVSTIVGPRCDAIDILIRVAEGKIVPPEKAAVLTRLQAAAYVGDSPPDMAAAVEAGARAVGVATGSFSGDDLARAGADVVLDSLAGFPAWYQTIRSGP